jgi:hypothetical protein
VDKRPRRVCLPQCSLIADLIGKNGSWLFGDAVSNANKNDGWGGGWKRLHFAALE